MRLNQQVSDMRRRVYGNDRGGYMLWQTERVVDKADTLFKDTIVDARRTLGNEDAPMSYHVHNLACKDRTFPCARAHPSPRTRLCTPKKNSTTCGLRSPCRCMECNWR